MIDLTKIRDVLIERKRLSSTLDFERDIMLCSKGYLSIITRGRMLPNIGLLATIWSRVDDLGEHDLASDLLAEMKRMATKKVRLAREDDNE